MLHCAILPLLPSHPHLVLLSAPRHTAHWLSSRPSRCRPTLSSCSPCYLIAIYFPFRHFCATISCFCILAHPHCCTVAVLAHSASGLRALRPIEVVRTLDPLSTLRCRPVDRRPRGRITQSMRYKCWSDFGGKCDMPA